MFCDEPCTAGLSSDVRVTTADYDVTNSTSSPARFNEEGCMIVPHDRLPWNNPHQIITREVSSLVNAISFLLSLKRKRKNRVFVVNLILFNVLLFFICVSYIFIFFVYLFLVCFSPTLVRCPTRL